MLNNVGDTALGILVTAVVTPIVAWFVGRAAGWLKWRPEQETARAIAISAACSLAIGLLLIAAYDRGFLPFTREAETHVVSHSFGQPVENVSRGTWLVTMTTFNPSQGNITGGTICAGTAASAVTLPNNFTECAASPTAMVTLNIGQRHTPITFVVPRGWFYKVVTDGHDPMKEGVWTETVLR
ncbi:hypothetical protein [Bradyrhizobium ganzhouense]|uniref:hypothetical protein n=1 Tax=Bradyrhizobium ganzhouense TaxID=1179767 RepID=UPI003CF9A27A